jgi:hypothetical protein
MVLLSSFDDVSFSLSVVPVDSTEEDSLPASVASVDAVAILVVSALVCSDVPVVSFSGISLVF